jgi:arsenite transporter
LTFKDFKCVLINFIYKGKTIIALPLDVIRVAIPLSVYFLIMFFGSMFATRKLGINYVENMSNSRKLSLRHLQ